jgi:hypothetical protein
MSRGYRLLLLIGLVVGIAPVCREPSGASQTDQIAIIDVSGESVAPERRRDLGQPFDRSRPCSERRPARTIREILGADAKAILVHRYDKPAWASMTVVTEYIYRMLVGRPEGGELQAGVYWAEGRAVEIVGSVEFRSGQKSRIEFANGYAHVQDDSGCEWWGRYLGGDRSHWIVRR